MRYGLFVAVLALCCCCWAQDVAMVVASSGFRDEELFRPKAVLEAAGLRVKVFADRAGLARGMLGSTMLVDASLQELKVEQVKAIVFVGGVGAQRFWNDPLAHRIVKEAVARGRVVGAICIAPVVLARAGVLKGRRATVWPSEAWRLKQAGAIYTGADVEVDGRIVTASGPQAAKRFGEAILRLLSQP